MNCALNQSERHPLLHEPHLFAKSIVDEGIDYPRRPGMQGRLSRYKTAPCGDGQRGESRNGRGDIQQSANCE